MVSFIFFIFLEGVKMNVKKVTLIGIGVCFLSFINQHAMDVGIRLRRAESELRGLEQKIIQLKAQNRGEKLSDRVDVKPFTRKKIEKTKEIMRLRREVTKQEKTRKWRQKQMAKRLAQKRKEEEKKRRKLEKLMQEKKKLEEERKQMQQKQEQERKKKEEALQKKTEEEKKKLLQELKKQQKEQKKKKEVALKKKQEEFKKLKEEKINHFMQNYEKLKAEYEKNKAKLKSVITIEETVKKNLAKAKELGDKIFIEFFGRMFDYIYKIRVLSRSVDHDLQIMLKKAKILLGELKKESFVNFKALDELALSSTELTEKIKEKKDKREMLYAFYTNQEDLLKQENERRKKKKKGGVVAKFKGLFSKKKQKN